jgi:hypothetical protein
MAGDQLEPIDLEEDDGPVETDEEELPPQDLPDELDDLGESDA